ncbi:zinc finger protein 335 [Lingula anatina]|uniref:Zinc finger protein 335 n=1 Tax=Lingula anatina TaxID=7574 RepID=A0A1S3H871_LINAN|nr:zinc finger protein 335 [Lingula anatina]XP_013382314.1 zinc finger protein 335 [Lingula anatina]XP_013382315.1 zinc finger protein 335 [Lingula anatina]XP_013382316.1 zinc finger protein 335 [Lingula anatina]XP_013382317.1 zinc finger protein 335 [Lingula anatina]XP_013382318.1 zinc finger protein 335 [Lingula anatina]|eukprot:XP_013382312.1 zinc finger protein 335 [Lingula anatina]
MFQPPPHLCTNGSVPPPLPPRMILTGGFNHGDPYRQPYVWGAAPPSRPPWLHFEDAPHGGDLRFNSPTFRCDRLKTFMVDKKLFQCPHCKYVTDRKNNLKRHVATMHDICTKLLECCDQIFPNKASLRDHVVRCHRDGYECRLCGRNFCRKALLKRHITVHSGKKDFVCSFCGYATSHRSNLERHKKRHTQANQGGGGEDAESKHSDNIDILNDDSMDEDDDIREEIRSAGPMHRTTLKPTGREAASLFRPFETNDNEQRENRDYDTDSNPSSPEICETRAGPNSLLYRHKKYRYMAVLKDKVSDTECDIMPSTIQHADGAREEEEEKNSEPSPALLQAERAGAHEKAPVVFKEKEQLGPIPSSVAPQRNDDIITVSKNTENKTVDIEKPSSPDRRKVKSSPVKEKESGFQINNLLKDDKSFTTTFHHYIDQHFNHKDHTTRKTMEPSFSLLDNDLNSEQRLHMARERNLYGGLTMDYQNRHFGDLIGRTSAHLHKFRYNDTANPSLFHASRDGYPSSLYDAGSYGHHSQGLVITAFRCDLCSKIFRDQLELREHYEQHHLVGRGPFQKPVRLLATVQICD